MNRKSIGFTVAAMMLALPVHAAEKKCELQQYAELPVTMAGTRPLIDGTINGSPARFLFDSGAFFSFISREAAQRHELKVGSVPPQIRVRGVGGAMEVGLAEVKEFTLTGFAGGRAIDNVDFLVGGHSYSSDTAGIIGQNIIGNADTEYDLANGMIRLFRPKGCNRQMLAYWHAGNAVAEMKIDPTTPASPHLIGTAKLNGKRVRVIFDTGAWRSVLTRRAAARAGIEPEDEGVTAAGLSVGFGKKVLENWLARFDTLDLGGEVIKNARLRLSDIDVRNGDMLLGADFFLSHRVYVASRQNKIYFTYNGGPVFDLRMNVTDPKGPTPGPVAVAPNAVAEGTGSAAALDAGTLRRRGAASAGRGDLQAAMADLDEAVKLDATDPENYYQRGMARWRNRQPLLAMADFDETLKLKPDHVLALAARGRIRLLRRDDPGASADFDAAARLAPGNPNIGLEVAQAFLNVNRFEEAIARLDTWIAANPKHDRLATALNDRCRSRAMSGKELDLALADCNAALKKGPRNSAIFDNRGFVHLRLGNVDDAIKDYQAALKLQPKMAISLYGLGLAQIRKGLQAEGEKDIGAALGIDAQIAEPFKRAGLAP